MLEVSFVQQLTALALLIELAYFRRLPVMGLFTVVVLITFAGTGLIMLMFAAPVVLLIIPFRIAILAVIVAIVGSFLMIWVGWFDIVTSRIAEFSTINTSGYFRFTLPIITFVSNLSDTDFWLSGRGAGATLKGTAYLLLPFAKLMSEYGLVTTVTFYAFLCVSIFRGTPRYFAAYALFLQYNIGGSTLAIPLNAALFLSLCTLFRVDRAALSARLNRIRNW